MLQKKLQWENSVWGLRVCIVQALRKHCETKAPLEQKLLLGEREGVEEVISLNISS